MKARHFFYICKTGCFKLLFFPNSSQRTIHDRNRATIVMSIHRFGRVSTRTIGGGLLHAARGVIFLILISCTMSLLFGSCAKKREIEPEETGVPNTMPREQVLYREARNAFLTWMSLFGGGEEYQKYFDLLSSRTRKQLATQQVTSSATFKEWIRHNRMNGIAPFLYRFSRVDIVDIQIRDSIKAIVTASFLLDTPDKQRESVGSFTLNREGGNWKIPLGDGTDWQRGWWQTDEGLNARIKDDGIASYSSSPFGLAFEYPVTWDVQENAAFRVPSAAGTHTGIEIAYLNPSTVATESFIRIWFVSNKASESPGTGPDTLTNSKLIKLQEENASLTDMYRSSGKVFVIEDRRNDRTIHVYAAVNEAAASYDNFSATLQRIVDSIHLPSEL